MEAIATETKLLRPVRNSFVSQCFIGAETGAGLLVASFSRFLESL
jgi:hypothetical protein